MLKKAIRTFSDMDKVLFFTSLILIIFGSLNIVTASSREAVVNADANMFYFFFVNNYNMLYLFTMVLGNTCGSLFICYFMNLIRQNKKD